ncbi:MAG: excinuclease ABC subunit UvrA [Candidatus Schekmanbacteria bacterium]|nr:excinuclease ABC subunit UvrA [Candidatus Schekmanbacteria bacterium]
MRPATRVIAIRGAREHNLANVDLDIPRDRLVVFTGPSGSGKSSLAIDTLYAEGRRRYVESLSTYARQFLGNITKPAVDFIGGLSPAIAIEQKGTNPNPRSTVGTVTEVSDYLRVMYARAGATHCPQCGRLVQRRSVAQMVDLLLRLPAGSRCFVLSPAVRNQPGDHAGMLDAARQEGFVRARIDGEIADLNELAALDGALRHTIEVVVDRLIIKDGVRARLAESLELALKRGDGVARVAVIDGGEHVLTARHRCMDCELSFPELSPASFSFNSPQGMCVRCNGLGAIFSAPAPPDGDAVGAWMPSPAEVCGDCGGARLNPYSRAVRLGGKSIVDVSAMTIAEAAGFFGALALEGEAAIVARDALKEVRARLGFLVDVGLTYLTLERPAPTLSGGEAQRIRLASQIGSGLAGVLYILDEPSIGLHQRDHQRLLRTLERLRDLGNTVVVVEHDRDTMLAADWIVDFGPGAGERGGRVIAAGTPESLAHHPESLTGAYLSNRRCIALPQERREPGAQRIVLRGARLNNLRDVTLDLPLGLLTCVTGVSGSGKSSLITRTLIPALQNVVDRAARRRPGPYTELQGWEVIQRVIEIDQEPIGRSPRSNPATYTGLFDHIRRLFAETPEARVRGYSAGRFSFNVPGGRCEACQGQGLKEIEMHFLPDVHVTCEICAGSRYDRETLEVRYRGANIAEVLAMDVAEARDHLRSIPAIQRGLAMLMEVGLDYLRLGQPATTLSGGEAQRIKLAAELAASRRGQMLYALDEPTTGLHFEDVRRLLSVLRRLRDDGNTIVVIEHNLDVIKCADHVIDLGPEGGDEGGEVVVAGTPEDVAACASSHTGQFLRNLLDPPGRQ